MVHPQTIWGQQKKWHPLGLSLVIHTLITLFLILWCFSGSRQLTEEKLRRGEIVLAVNFEDHVPEYLTQPEPTAEPIPPASAATNVPSEPGVNSVPAVTVALIAAIPTANI